MAPKRAQKRKGRTTLTNLPNKKSREENGQGTPKNRSLEDKRQMGVFYNVVKSGIDRLKRLASQVEKYQQDELHLAEHVSATDSTSDASLGEAEESIMTRLDQVIDDIDSHIKSMCPNIIKDVGPPAAKVRKENSTIAKDNRSLILQDYDSSGWFATKQALRDSLHSRFQDVKILVDSNAKKVCFQKLSREGSLQAEYKYYVNYAGLPKSTLTVNEAGLPKSILTQPKYHMKWMNPCPENSAALEFVKGHFAETTRYMYADYSSKKVEWKVTYLDPAKPVAPVSQDTVRKFEENLNIMGLGYFDVAVRQFPSLFHAAFVNNLCNSVGREGIVALLEYACKVAFGYDCLQRNFVNIGSVGTSPYLPERFPVVNAVSPPQGERSVSKLRSLSDIRPPSDYQEHEGYGWHTSAAYASQSPEDSWKSQRGKFMYPDIVVSTADGSHWCKYLLLCEIKSGPGFVTDAEHCQLMRQLIAACMHQTEVFGIIIKSQCSRLLRILHDPVKRRLDACLMDFGFLELQSDQFSLHALNDLFLHLVELLDYGKTEIKQVEIRL